VHLLTSLHHSIHFNIQHDGKVFVTQVTSSRRQQSRLSAEQLLPSGLEHLATRTHTNYLWSCSNQKYGHGRQDLVHSIEFINEAK